MDNESHTLDKTLAELVISLRKIDEHLMSLNRNYVKYEAAKTDAMSYRDQILDLYNKTLELQEKISLSRQSSSTEEPQVDRAVL